VLQRFSETEKKYARDYRFPYERARTVVNLKRNFRREAFAALNRAAQKAITGGKAGEMLENLNADKDGDFQKLSHGHREWVQLQRALKTNDARVLYAEDTF
jgi:ABC-type cobalamin/Fe3+-siderophores transport system ATPase subunit